VLQIGLVTGSGVYREHKLAHLTLKVSSIWAGHAKHNYTCGDLLFIQVCIDARPMHCSTAQGTIAFPLFSVTLQNRVTASLSHCNYTYEDLLFIQVCIVARPMHCRLV